MSPGDVGSSDSVFHLMVGGWWLELLGHGWNLCPPLDCVNDEIRFIVSFFEALVFGP